MKKQKMPVAPAQTHQVDIDALIAPYEVRCVQRELELTQEKLRCSEKMRIEEKRAAQKEKDGIMGFVGVVALLVVFAMCMLSKEMWTAIFPVLGLVAIMKKVGWI